MKTKLFPQAQTSYESFLEMVRSGIPGRVLIKKRILIPAVTLLLIFMKHYEPFNFIAAGMERERVLVFIAQENPSVPAGERALLAEAILDRAKRLEIPANVRIDGRPVNRVHFLTALIRVESTFYRFAVSSADARGYMQVMPATALWMDGLRGTSTPAPLLFHTGTNIERGVAYLNMLFKEMPDARLVCLAYNAGPNAVRAGYYEERYWVKILTHYRELERGDFFAKAKGQVTSPTRL